MIRGIHHMTVHVRDLERMKRFYKEAFGFEDIGFSGGWSDNPVLDEIIGVDGSAAQSAMLCAHNCYLELFHFSAPASGSSRALDPQDYGYTHFCVDVTDIEAEAERLAGIGMTFDREGGKRRGRPFDVQIVKAIYGRDPEGNLIELQETAPDCVFAARNLPKATIAS